MKARDLYLLEVAFAVTAAVALVLLFTQHAGLQNVLWALWPWVR